RNVARSRRPISRTERSGQPRYTVRPTSEQELPLPRFYITTAIDYVNGQPHLGHAYEKVFADVLPRAHRQRGDQTYFLTGTDEHAKKVAKTAADAGIEPKAFVDQYVQHFKTAWKALLVNYDQFIRTTDQRHELAVQSCSAGCGMPARRKPASRRSTRTTTRAS